MSTVKNLPKIWWIKEYIQDNGYDVGHKIFSLGHIIWILVIVLAAILVAKYYKKSDDKRRATIRRVFAIILFLLEYLKVLTIGFLYPDYVSCNLPVHMCSIAGIIVLFDALWPNNKYVKTLFTYFVLPCGIVAILSPSTSYPWLNLFCAHVLVYHGILVIYSVMKISANEADASYKALWLASILPLLYMIPATFINNTFNQNFLFLNSPTDFPLLQLLWDKATPIFGHAGYVASIMILAVIIFHIIYLIGKLLTRHKK